MPKVTIYNQKAEKVAETDLASNIFDVKINHDLIHQAMLAQMGNERQVLAHTKGRSEVRGGGKKPWKQKGTGRARAGSSRSPIWIGGGVTFGPTNNRNFSKRINKKMKIKAVCMVFSDKVISNDIRIVDELIIENYKTKDFNNIINALLRADNNKSEKDDSIKTNKKSVLIINDKNDEKVRYSASNIPGTKVINMQNINILDLLKYRNLIITQNGIKELEKRHTK